jgi:TRAP-type C4-dicarboxylate transport system permease small subunit
MPTKNKFDKIVIGFFSLVLVIGTIAITGVLTWATVSRYVFKRNFMGFEEIAILIACWLYFAGAAYAAYNNTHIAVSVVDSYLKDSMTKRILIFIRWLITAAVCGLFTYYAYDFFMFNFLGPLGDFRFQPTTQLWRIPMWASVLAVFVGFVFMEIYFIRNMVLSGKALFQKTPVPQQEPLLEEF